MTSIPGFLVAALRRNPYPVYSAMRKIAPVLHDRVHGLWMLFDFESVKRALNDHEAFSSRAAPPGDKPLDWLIFLDPPLHTKMRAIVMRTFTPRAIASLEPRIRERTDTLLDEVIERGTMDLVVDFADRLPVMVIADMIGVPEDVSRLRGWTDAILHLGDAVGGGEAAARAIRNFRAAKDEMRPYLHELLEARRASPKDDLLTRLVEAEVDGERLGLEEILGFFQLLLFAGSETTTNLIGNAMLCFLERTDVLARVRANLDLLPAAIEEVLRYRTPVQLVFRSTARDVVMHGKTIPAGQLVLAMVGSANRDRKQFENADRFDITRQPNAHVAFGHGAHFCIGASLARLEGRIALARLLERLDGLRGESRKPWPPRSGLNVYGPTSLPVQFEKGRRVGQGLDRS